MNLKQWKLDGRWSYDKILEKITTVSGKKYSRCWVINVFNGKKKAGEKFRMVLKKVTGLSAKEIKKSYLGGGE